MKSDRIEYESGGHRSPLMRAYRDSPDTERMPSLPVMFLRCVITVLMEMYSLSAISLFVSPLATSLITSFSLADSSEGVSAAA